MRRAAALLFLGLALAACGKKEMLKAADNRPLPPKPRTAASQPTPASLLDPGTQSRPQRFNELVTKSQALKADHFDMPPPG